MNQTALLIISLSLIIIPSFYLIKEWCNGREKRKMLKLYKDLLKVLDDLDVEIFVQQTKVQLGEDPKLLEDLLKSKNVAKHIAFELSLIIVN